MIKTSQSSTVISDLQALVFKKTLKISLVTFSIGILALLILHYALQLHTITVVVVILFMLLGVVLLFSIIGQMYALSVRKKRIQHRPAMDLDEFIIQAGFTLAYYRPLLRMIRQIIAGELGLKEEYLYPSDDFDILAYPIGPTESSPILEQPAIQAIFHEVKIDLNAEACRNIEKELYGMRSVQDILSHLVCVMDGKGVKGRKRCQGP